MDSHQRKMPGVVFFFNVHLTYMETNMFADTHFKIRHAEDERHFLANSWDSGAGYLIYLP